ncbi:Phage baseplate assembly protein [Psychrobacter nivimaris]|uniref:Phage baseplate assembly protein n=1 Tax=Psychrobacter nivimaris TaxID=281738 RepID=A0A6N7C1I5_9GAMM|nr:MULTISPECIES: GPW/gp25 family protein [Psychrobacter]KAF0569151.1 Phage baseplate assembly protein [Psychrobacter nivimaris]
MLNQDNNVTVINVKGMSRSTGQRIDQTNHILQSVRDILMTPIGSRVMRRDYGSLLPFLIDAPINAYFIMQLRASVIHALMRWETRVTPTRIELMTDDSASQGVASLMIEYRYVISKKIERTYLSLGGAL